MQASTIPHVLLIEDDGGLAANLREVLEDEGFRVSVISRGDEGLKFVDTHEAELDVVLTDLRLPGLGGLDLVRKIHESHKRLPILLMTAHGSIETAIEATKQGAYDYLQKPFDMPELILVLSKAVEAGRRMRDPVMLTNAPVRRTALIGVSRAMQDVCKEIGRIAPKPVTVLIRGETGTGKELIARAIYQHSSRSESPFVAINCGAIPENLLESELFGHERGAFTGADQRRVGRFEQANRGTLFLDEIGDLPAQTQVKLLRVLQEQTFHRVGGTEPIHVDVRILAATHRDLESMIQAGKFREDLMHRLNVVSLTLPPLRERREDIPVLAQHFLGKNAEEFGVERSALTAEAMGLLQAESWPGNIRELENVVRRLLLEARGLAIGPELVKRVMQNRNLEAQSVTSLARKASALLVQAQKGEIADAHQRLLAEAEREIITQAILLAGGNQAQASRWLGISRLTLREKLTSLGLRTKSTSGDESNR